MSPKLYLTPRERDVLAFLVEGKTNREIAAHLYVSQATVKGHLSSVYEKLGVSNRTEAAVTAVRLFPALSDLEATTESRVHRVGDGG